MRLSNALLASALLAALGRAVEVCGETPSENDVDRKIAQAEQLFEDGHTAQAAAVAQK